ncbi:MAG: hypothetical protein J6R05_05415, partial [Bacteroidaceae bacterium]|nr:hypothetical protein [Bacteroidaceae bacterium]
MKKVSSLFRTLVCGAMLAGALAGCKPSVQELSLEIPFKCNAYVTPLDSASKVTPAFANNIIANGYSLPNDAEMIPGAWLPSYQQEVAHQVSVYFYTAFTGKLQLGLRAADVPQGESVLKVKCCG